MKLALALVLGVVVVGCGEENPARHLPDAAPVDGVTAVELVVTRAGNGSGTVQSSPDGIACGESCKASFPAQTMVTLTAEPSDGSTFAGWSGACAGEVATCDVTLEAAASVTATFTLAKHTVTVTKTGPGNGMIKGAGLDCDGSCTVTVDHGTALSFTATPASLAVFGGWGGACSGMGTCDVTVTSDITVSASFALDNFTLFVVGTGTGTGSVASTPSGISCGSDCNQVFTANQMITLTATPSTGSTFAGWSGGGCSGVGTCVVTVDDSKTVTARFTLNRYALTVTTTGIGTVTGTGINCGTDCNHTFNHGTNVTLTASAATGHTFTGWGGACTGTGSCTVAMTAARSVTATFKINTYALTVTKTGLGTVTGTGISCGTDCNHTYNHGTPVTLSAAPATGYSFAGWSGACSGTGACTVTMDAAKSVGATFTINSYALMVSKVGSGTVTGTGINCGMDCTETYNFGTPVTLSATPATGYSFAGWSGACTGMGACSVTIDASKSVTATFKINTYALSVSKVGSGTVTGTGISCGTDCNETYSHGTSVVLTASPTSGFAFTGWSGACTGTGSCTVSMTAARAVTANFAALVTLTVVKSGSGTGTITGGGMNCDPTCTISVVSGTTVTLTPTPSTASSTLSKFTGWSGACNGTGTCTLTVTASDTLKAVFTLQPNIMFVTKNTFTGSLGGLNGADGECKIAASQAGLPGTYRAYLSSIEPGQVLVTAPSRVGTARGWVRVDGVPVMNTIDQMQTGLFNAPSVMENNVDVSQTQVETVWTGTSQAGSYHSACMPAGAFLPWQGPTGSAMVGHATDPTFRAATWDNMACDVPRRLYCLGIDRAAAAQ